MASNNIARLGVVLALDSAQFKADIDQAIASTRNLKQQIARETNAAAGEIINLKHATEDYGKTLTKVEQIQREITSGRFMHAEQKYKDELLARAAAYDKVVAGQNKLNKGITDQQKIQVSYQMTDLVTQIASGQNAMIALMQQGGQLKDTFGGIGNMFRALAGMITLTRVAFVGIGTAVAGLGAAFISGMKESIEFRDALILTSNYSGLLTKDISKLSFEIGGKLNISVGQVKDSLLELASSGKFSDTSIQSVNEAVLRFAKLTGTDAKTAAKQLGGMFDGTANSAFALNQKYHFLTEAQYKNIEALERANKRQEAMQMTADALNNKLKSQTEQIGALEKAWNSFWNVLKNVWEFFKQIGQEETLSTKKLGVEKYIASLEKQLQSANAFARLSASEKIEAAKEQLRLINQQIAKADTARAKQEEEENRIENYRATGGAAGAISRAAELEKAKIETRYSMMQHYLSEEINLERNAAKEIELARSEAKYKNMTENGRLAAHNAAMLAEREKQINAQLEKDKAETRRQYREQAMEEQQRELQEYRDAAASRMETEARAAIAMRDDFDLQERALNVARQKASISTDLLFVSETERRIAESRLDAEQKIFELRRNKSLSSGEIETGINRLKDIQSMREGLIAFEESIARVNAKWDSVFNNMANALDNFVRTGKLSFKDLARSIIADLISIEMRAQGKILFGLLKAAILGSGGYTDAQNTIVGEVGLPMKRASGGTISAGSPYMVGERGPELFVPSQSGTIIPNNNLSSMSSGGQVINNYNISAIDVKSFEERILGSSRAIWAANAYANKSLAVAQGRA